MVLSAAAKQALRAAMKVGDLKLARRIATTGDVPKLVPGVDRRLKDALDRSRVAAAADELETTIRRRFQRGKSVPKWFDATKSGNSLMDYNMARIKSGAGGLGGTRTAIRSEKEAAERLARVKANDSSPKVDVEKVKELQRLCGVSDNPRVCAKVSDLVEKNLMYVKQLGFYRGQQHAWNVMPDGTIVDATAAQFGLPDINIVPPRSPMQRHYKPFTEQQVKFEEDRVLWEPWARGRSNEDYMSWDYGHRKFSPDMDNNNWSTFRDDYNEMQEELGFRNPLEIKERLRRQFGSWGG